MNEVADRLDPRPPAGDGAELCPGKIGEKVRLAISAGAKERQRVGRELRRRNRLSSVVDLILTSVAAKDAIEPQRHRPGRRRQPSDNVAAGVDEAFGRDGGRDPKIRLLGHAAAQIGVDVHHRENCRWLRKFERNVVAVANVHAE